MKKDMVIAVCFPLDESHRSILQKNARGAKVVYSGDPEYPNALKEAEIIFGNPELSELKSTNRLKLLQLASAGAEHYVAPGVLPDGAVLANASGAYGASIAEYMLCMVMNLFLDLPRYRDQQRRHIWKESKICRHIPGTTALVVGLGNIGSEFARRYRAMGGHVIGVKRTAAPKPDYLDELITEDSLDEFLPRADVVTASLPSTPETRHLFDRQKFSRMKSGSVFVNVGRGDLVDTDALCEALQSGRLLGAALDVTDPEPLPENHPLWNLPNVFLTPHISGRWYVPDNLRGVFQIWTDNLGRYLDGRPLKNLVNPQKGY